MPGKSDIARYEILKEVGGIYLDADFDIFAPIDKVVALGRTTGFVVVRESKGTFNNAFLASCPSHPLVTELSNGVGESAESYRSSGPVMRLGPHYVTEKICAHVAMGNRVTELPQSWIYPYFYDRPDLSETAVSAETLLRHEWASAGHKWTESGGHAPATKPRQDRIRRIAASVRNVRPATLKSELSALPEAHVVREWAYGSLARLTAFGQPRGSVASFVPANGSPAQSLAGIPARPLPAAIRWAVNSMIRQRIRGSATYMELGIDSGEHWRLASRRLDRPGRSIRVVGNEMNQPGSGLETESALDALDTVEYRGSRAIAVARDAGLTSGKYLFTSGTPLVPRVLDSTRSLDRWNETEVEWTLPWLIESCPHIDLQVVGPSVNLEVAAPHVLALVKARRLGSVLCIVDPISTKNSPLISRGFLEALEPMAMSVTCPGSIPKQGDRGWRVQMRAAQQLFAVKMDFRSV